MTLDFRNQPGNLRPFTTKVRPGTTFTRLITTRSAPGSTVVISPRPVDNRLPTPSRWLRANADRLLDDASNVPLNPYSRAFVILWLLAMLAAVCAPYLPF